MDTVKILFLLKIKKNINNKNSEYSFKNKEH